MKTAYIRNDNLSQNWGREVFGIIKHIDFIDK